MSRSRRAPGSTARRPCSAWVGAGLCLILLCAEAAAFESAAADAAALGDMAAVRKLLRQGADPNAAQGDGMTALHWAARRGDVALAELLLYAGARVGAGTRIGRYTPLHLASRGGHYGVVQTLLRANSDVHASTSQSGATPLHLAAAAGNSLVVRALVEGGADVNAREASWGQTPLIFAASEGRVKVVKTLLELGADPSLTAHVVDVVERERADRAAEQRLSEFLKQFREKEGGGSDWQPKPSQVQAAIQASRAIQRRWPDVPKPGEEKGPVDLKEQEVGGSDEAAGEGASEDPDRQSQEGEGAQEVSTLGQGDLVQSGAGTSQAAATPVKYNAEGEPVYDDSGGQEEKSREEPKPLTYGQLVGSWGGLTALLHAVRQGHAEVVLALLDGGADVDQPSAGDHTTPLLMASVNGQFDLALTLLRGGADPNRASDAGTTPLFAVLERTWAPRASYSHPTEHHQQKADHLQVVGALLSSGADPNVRLKTHLWYMEYTFQVLRRAGIHLAGATPFWRAAQALDVDAMRLLREYGADPAIATIKPPRRRRPDPKEEPTVPPNRSEPLKPTEPGGDAPANPQESDTEGESSDYDSKADQEEDHSGRPPVPVGGPFLFPIHAAAGAGYGQSFAGNAHRHVPDNWLAAVRFLVEECGSDVNLRDANGYTALHHAASRGDNALVLYLVEKGADVTVISRKGQTTADMANGPIERLSPFPETVALLEKLGSRNNHNCISC